MLCQRNPSLTIFVTHSHADTQTGVRVPHSFTEYASEQRLTKHMQKIRGGKKLQLACETAKSGGNWKLRLHDTKFVCGA